MSSIDRIRAIFRREQALWAARDRPEAVSEEGLSVTQSRALPQAETFEVWLERTAREIRARGRDRR